MSSVLAILIMSCSSEADSKDEAPVIVYSPMDGEDISVGPDGVTVMVIAMDADPLSFTWTYDVGYPIPTTTHRDSIYTSEVTVIANDLTQASLLACTISDDHNEIELTWPLVLADQ